MDARTNKSDALLRAATFITESVSGPHARDQHKDHFKAIRRPVKVSGVNKRRQSLSFYLQLFIVRRCCNVRKSRIKKDGRQVNPTSPTEPFKPFNPANPDAGARPGARAPARPPRGSSAEAAADPRGTVSSGSGSAPKGGRGEEGGSRGAALQDAVSDRTQRHR